MTEIILTATDRERIRDAVAAAEANTAGEIFTVVAETADDYRSVPVLWATFAALAVPLPLIFLTLLPASAIFLIQLAVFVVLAMVLSLPNVLPHVVPPSVKHAAARSLAVQQFLAHGLHMTERRTGVLIFVALAERHAEIIADAGIAAKVDDAVWHAAMDTLIAEIKAGRFADGLIAAIATTGSVLVQHFPKRGDDRDELPNALILL